MKPYQVQSIKKRKFLYGECSKYCNVVWDRSKIKHHKRSALKHDSEIYYITRNILHYMKYTTLLLHTSVHLSSCPWLLDHVRNAVIYQSCVVRPPGGWLMRYPQDFFAVIGSSTCSMLAIPLKLKDESCMLRPPLFVSGRE